LAYLFFCKKLNE